jgi:16S rRNA (cytosine967-C5)-methyltransferase
VRSAAGRHAGAGAADGLALRYAHPPWLVRRWLQRHARADVESLLVFNQCAPDLAFWPAPDAGDLAAALQSAGVECAPARYVPGALRARGGTLPFTPLHRQGRFTIQDEASQLVVWMLDRPIRGPVLDLCAGSGGKTAQIIAAASPEAFVVAADRSRRALRALRVRLRQRRLAPPALLAADGEAGGALRAQFRVVLLDAPCTGTGVLRRRPEIKERLEPADLINLAARQDRLLEEAAQRTAPGGELLYAVCSLEPEEGEERVESFLRGHAEFERAGPGEEFPGGARALLTARGDLCTLPWRHEVDGFFASRLRRRR